MPQILDDLTNASGVSNYGAILENLTRLYLEDPRPWLVGFSGGKDSTMVASLIFETILSVPPEERTKCRLRLI